MGRSRSRSRSRDGGGRGGDYDINYEWRGRRGGYGNNNNHVNSGVYTPQQHSDIHDNFYNNHGYNTSSRYNKYIHNNNDSTSLTTIGNLDSVTTHTHTDTANHTSDVQDQHLIKGPLLTFKQYVIKKSDNLGQEQLNNGYKSYLVDYKKHHAELFFVAHHKDAFMREVYHPNLLREQFELAKGWAKSASDTFLKKWEMGNFNNLVLEVEAEDNNNPTTPPPQQDSSPLLYTDWTRSIKLYTTNNNENSIKNTNNNNKINTDNNNNNNNNNNLLEDNKGVNMVDIHSTNLSSDLCKNRSFDVEQLLHPEDFCLVVEQVDPLITKFDIMKCLAKRNPIHISMVEGQSPIGARTAYVYFKDEVAKMEAIAAGAEFLVVRLVTERDEKGTEKELLKEFRLVLTEQLRPRVVDAVVTPPIACTRDRLIKDREMSWQLIRTLDGQLDVCDENCRHLLEEALETVESDWLKLDLQITYLRHVHCLCYYNGKVYNDLQQLHLNSAAIHLRPIVPPLLLHFMDTEIDCMDENENVEEFQVSVQQKKWVEELDIQILSLLHTVKHMKENLPPQIDEENNLVIQKKWQAFCQEHTGKDTEGKYRCTLCHKLFKAPGFVHMHLRKKHERERDNIIEKFVPHIMKTAYLNDPNKALMFPQCTSSISSSSSSSSSHHQYKRSSGGGGHASRNNSRSSHHHHNRHYNYQGPPSNDGYPYNHRYPHQQPPGVPRQSRRYDWDTPDWERTPGMATILSRPTASYDDL